MAEQEQQPIEQNVQQPAADPAPAAQVAPEAQPQTVTVPAEVPERRERPQGRGHGGGRGGPGGRGQGRPQRSSRRMDDEAGGVESSVVRIYRCAKVVKGGRTFSFGALVVVGDRKGNVGIGYGKANEVPPSVEKATKDARKAMFKVNLRGTTIPHIVKGRAGSSSIVLVPARSGTGVTAGKSVRPVLELAGITDVLSKAYGSTSAKNLVKATIDALRQLRNREQVERVRGVSLPAGAGEIAAV